MSWQRTKNNPDDTFTKVYCFDLAAYNIMTITSETSDFNIVRDVMKKTPLLSLKLRWDWKEFEWLYVFTFNGAWMYTGPVCDPYFEDEIGLVRHASVDDYMQSQYAADVSEAKRQVKAHNKHFVNQPDMQWPS